jgi:dipeptidyl-peptidase-4
MLHNASLLEEMVHTRSWTLGLPEQPRATRDGAVVFLRSGPRDAERSVYEMDLGSGETRRLVAPEQLPGAERDALSPEERARRERMRVVGGGFTGFELSEDERNLLLTLGGRIYLVERAAAWDRRPDAWRILAEPGEPAQPLLDPKFSPDARHVSFVRGVELHVLELASGHEWPLTSGGSEELTHGVAEFVAQEEMSRFSGQWWSPDGRRLAVQQTDLTAVERLHIANPADPAQRPLGFRYPRAGSRNASVRLGLVQVQGGPMTWVHWDSDRFPYLAHVQWNAGAPLTIQVQTRDQRRLRLLEVDVETGKTSELLEISDPHWVNLHSETRYPGYLWLESGAGFLWTREVEAGWVLELRSADGSAQWTLCGPELGLLKLWGAWERDGWALVEAGVPPERRLYHVPLAGGGPEELLPESPPGVHTAVPSGPGRPLVHIQSTADRMPRCLVRELSRDGSAGRVLGELPSVAEPLPEALHNQAEFVRLTPSGRGALLLRPAGFEPHKRYPVLLSVYGGPHVNKVLRSRATMLQEAWLASEGFAVVCIDGRGSWGRGRGWERPLARRLGSAALEEQASGLQELARGHEFLDLSRVGIYGWSFGGYLAALAVMRRPDLFKAAAAGAPVTDWSMYDTHYTERYLGLPAEEPEAYREESLLAHAAGLKRPLMLLHGIADDNVYFSHTLRLADALIRAGCRFELVPLAGQTHRVQDPELFRRQWELIAEFFARHLGPGRQAPEPPAAG